MVMGYWSVAILFWQLSIDHIVNVQCKRCGFTKTRLRHSSLPFDSLPYLTRTICRRVRTVNHVTTKQKEVDHISWVWGSVPRALRAREPRYDFNNSFFRLCREKRCASADGARKFKASPRHCPQGFTPHSARTLAREISRHQWSQ